MTDEPRGIRKLNIPKSIQEVGVLASQFYQDLREAPERGQKVAWAGGYPTPFPLLKAMDVAYLFEDVYAATAAARHLEGELQLVSANRGYPDEMCSYARTTLGMAHMDEKQRASSDPYYQMPKPDIMTYVDIGCSMINNWSDAGRRVFGAPMFGIHVPFVRSVDEEEEVIQETMKQFQEMTVFLEDTLDKPFNWDSLHEQMVHVKEATTLRSEAYDIAGRAAKSPATFFDWAAAIGCINYALGTRKSVDLMHGIKNEMQDRVDNGISALPNEEVRAFWMGHMCWPYMRWWGDLLADLNVNVVAANYTHMAFLDRPNLIDPSDPLRSLAANSIICFGQSIDIVAQRIVDMMREYHIDAIICHNTQTCRVFPAPFREITEIVQRELGCPVVFFDGDVADKNFFSQEQTRTRVETLKEMVLSQKAKAGAVV